MPEFPSFFNLTGELANFDSAKVAILPVPYEKTVSFLPGTAGGPRALLEASEQMEDYDEALGQIPCRVGIHTCDPLSLPEEPREALAQIEDKVGSLLDDSKFPVVIGGEHSISVATVRALRKVCPKLGVVQLDAHADLRSSYEGSPHSHASVMARIREETADVVQLGIRAVSSGEMDRVRSEGLCVGFLHEMRDNRFDWRAAVAALPEHIFVTFDVDVMDLSVIRATGTPEPGGLSWQEASDILTHLFTTKRVVGFDLVELCGGDVPSAYSAARLVYRMIGLAFQDHP